MEKKTNVPKLRFPEFEGEWVEKRLEDLFSEFKSGQGITSTDIFEDGKYPVFGGNGLRGFCETFTHDGFYFLIGRQGALCGNINRTKGKAYISEHAIACKANDSSDTEWLAQRLDFLNLNKLSESSAQPGLAVNKLLRLKLIVPKQKEQTKIASFLTAADDKLTQLKKKKSLLEEYKKGVMQKIFSQELRFKDDNGEDFPEWEEKKLGEVVDVKGGKRIPKGYSLQSENNGYPYITVSDMKEGSVLTDNIQYVPIDVVEQISNYKISTSDIYISVAGTLGLVGIIPKELDNANLTENANKLTNLKCDQTFLYQFLTGDDLKKLIESVKTIGAQPKLAIYALNDFSFYLPSLPEQTKIANFLSAIDEKINHCSKQIERMDDWKKGLLQQMFV